MNKSVFVSVSDAEGEDKGRLDALLPLYEAGWEFYTLGNETHLADIGIKVVSSELATKQYDLFQFNFLAVNLPTASQFRKSPSLELGHRCGMVSSIMFALAVQASTTQVICCNHASYKFVVEKLLSEPYMATSDMVSRSAIEALQQIAEFHAAFTRWIEEKPMRLFGTTVPVPVSSVLA